MRVYAFTNFKEMRVFKNLDRAKAALVADHGLPPAHTWEVNADGDHLLFWGYRFINSIREIKVE